MSEPVSVQYLGRVLLRSWILVLVCFLAGGALAVAASALLTPVYTATATQLVKGLSGKGGAASYEAAQFAVNRAKSYPSFVYSRAVLEGVRSDLDNGASVDDLRKELSATNPADTPLVMVTATGRTPEEARDKANSAARQLARFITQIETVAGTSPIGVETPVEAALPTDTTSPKRLLMGAVGALLGFAIGSLIALVRARRRSRPQEQAPDASGWWGDDAGPQGGDAPEQVQGPGAAHLNGADRGRGEEATAGGRRSRLG